MREAIASAVVAVIVLVAYIPLVSHSIPGGDSGELVAEACQLGVAHPPGYPLYTLIARAALSFLPSRWTPAYRVNILSIVMTAAAAAGVTRGALHTIAVLARVRTVAQNTHTPAGRLLLASAAGLAVAAAPLIAMYGIGAEVFALNNLFVSALLCAVAALAREALTVTSIKTCHQGTDTTKVIESRLVDILFRRTLIGSVLSGLALTNQHTAVLLVIPIAIWVARLQWQVLTLRSVIAYAVAFAIGLLPYAHLPMSHIFARRAGSWGDTSTFTGFVRHVLRRDYGTFRLVSRTNGHVESATVRNSLWFVDLWTVQLPAGGGLLVIVGFIVCAATAVAALFQTRRRITSMADAGDDPDSASHSLHMAAPAAGLLRHRTIRKSATSLPPSHENVALLQCVDHAAKRQAAHCSRRAVLQRFTEDVVIVAPTQPAVLVGALVVYLLVFHGLSNMPLRDPLLNGVHARFWQQPLIISTEIAAVGAASLLEVALPAVVTLLPVHARAPGKTAISIMYIITGLASLVTIGLHFLVHREALDQSHNDVFDRYGAALLAPLPANSILITAYDFQWTSTRYMQTCRGMRPDVVLLNSAIMSFDWFSTARSSYPNVSWPGTHLVRHLTAPHARGGFSLADFFSANMGYDGGAALVAAYDNAPPHDDFRGPGRTSRAANSRLAATPLSGGIFYAGAPDFTTDAAHTQLFELQPYGFVDRVTWLDTRKMMANVTWRDLGVRGVTTAMESPRPRESDVAMAALAWIRASAKFDGNVSLSLFGASTWEHAARLHYGTRAVTYGTWTLDWALGSNDNSNADPDTFDVRGTLLAASLLEDALKLQMQEASNETSISSATWKNLGLAYVRLVRGARPFPSESNASWPCIPGFPDICNPSLRTENSARSAYAQRALDAWSIFLLSSGARQDAGYAYIVTVVSTLRAILMPSGIKK